MNPSEFPQSSMWGLQMHPSGIRVGNRFKSFLVSAKSKLSITHSVSVKCAVKKPGLFQHTPFHHGISCIKLFRPSEYGFVFFSNLSFRKRYSGRNICIEMHQATDMIFYPVWLHP